MPRKSWTKRALAGVLAGAVALTLAAGANAETLEEPPVNGASTTSDVVEVTPEPTEVPSAPALELPETSDAPVATDAAEPAVEATEPVAPDVAEDVIPNESIPVEEVLADMPLSLDSMALPAGAKPVYRFYSAPLGGHHYTISETEKNEIQQRFGNMWRYEQVAFYAFDKPAAGTVPVHRFWSEKYKAHFYTVSESEANTIKATWPDIWTPEGIAFYAYPNTANVAGAGNVFRYWSPFYGRHFFTASVNEKNQIDFRWPGIYNSEGTPFKVFPVAEKSTQQAIAESAIEYLGYPYAWAGAHPSTGFDCSGYIKWVVQQATGKTLYHGASQQAAAMTRIPASQAVPGDFWFRGSPGSYGHVGVYMGNNRIAHSPDYGRLTSIQTIWTSGDFYRFNG